MKKILILSIIVSLINSCFAEESNLSPIRRGVYVELPYPLPDGGWLMDGRRNKRIALIAELTDTRVVVCRDVGSGAYVYEITVIEFSQDRQTYAIADQVVVTDQEPKYISMEGEVCKIYDKDKSCIAEFSYNPI